MLNLKDKETLYLKAKDTYYAGNPIMTDAEFDILEEKLKEAGSTVPFIVGSVKAGKFLHPSPMGTLGKLSVYDSNDMQKVISEFDNWSLNIKSKGVYEFEVTPKFDGNSMNLVYEYGILENALTRGDGENGFDQKSKMLFIVPNKISIQEKIEVRGEVVIPIKIFDKKYAKKFKNARNFVAGILSRDEINKDIIKDLVFVAYELRIHKGNSFEFPLKNKTIDILTNLGFNKEYPIYVKYFNDIKEFKKIYDEFEEYREKYSPFQLDGMVIKGDEKYRNTIGFR